MVADDFAVGQLVTVLEWRRREIPLMDFATGTTVVHTVSDNSYKGDILTIEAVSLPYIAVRTAHGRVFNLDTREASMVRLDHAYVEALVRPRPSTDS